MGSVELYEPGFKSGTQDRTAIRTSPLYSFLLVSFRFSFFFITLFTFFSFFHRFVFFLPFLLLFLSSRFVFFFLAQLFVFPSYFSSSPSLSLSFSRSLILGSLKKKGIMVSA